MADILASEGVPRCSCGGIIKPDVVLYEEPLDEAVLDRAVCHIRQADLLLIGGTSLNVYPAAGLIRYFQGRDLVIINREPTPGRSAGVPGDTGLHRRDIRRTIAFAPGLPR